MALSFKDKDDIGFKDFVEFKLLLDEMYQEILITPKEQGVLYGLRNSLGYWQEIFLSDKYSLVWILDEETNEKIGFSIARYPDSKEVFYIDYVYVKPKYRKQGLATGMISRQIDFAKKSHSYDEDNLILRSRRLEPIVETLTQ